MSSTIDNLDLAIQGANHSASMCADSLLMRREHLAKHAYYYAGNNLYHARQHLTEAKASLAWADEILATRAQKARRARR